MHSDSISMLREDAEELTINHLLAADLLEMHDRKSLSLDNWGSARKFVEHYIGHSITPNGA